MNSSVNDNDGGVYIQTNKWRPYYYDLYNRIGNLTVLSLSRRRNAVIENLHTYKSSSNTWHDRLKRKFPEQEFTDYSAVRIYWKYGERDEASKDKIHLNFPLKYV